MDSVILLINALVPVISGPAAAVAVCLIAMYGAGYILVKFILPEQRDALNKVLADSAETRKVFEHAVHVIEERFRSIEKNVSAVRKDIDKVEKDISEIKNKI